MRVSLLIIAGLLVLAPVADATDKATLNADLDALFDSVLTAKAAGDYVNAELLLVQYETLLATAGIERLDMTAGIAPPSAPAAPTGSTASLTSGSSNVVNAIISNAGAVSDSIAIASGDTYIHDVDVTVNITHTWNSDLDVTLTSPTGTVIALTTGNGGSNDDVFDGTLFDSSSLDGATFAAYADGVTSTPLQADGDLSGFRGEDPNGNWTLTIDDAVGGDDGSSGGWSIDVTTLDAAPTEATTNHAQAHNLAVLDGVPVFDTITVGGLGTYLCDVNVTTNITHTWNSDLQVFVESPSGTFGLLAFGDGGSNDNVFDGTVFDASAADSSSDFAYANLVTAGTVSASGSAGAWIGEDPNGDWELTIFDGVGGDTGASSGWTLDLTTCIGVAPECFLVIGDAPVDGPFQHTPFWGHEFTTQVGSVNEWYPVLMEDIPSFLLPNQKTRRKQVTQPSNPTGSIDDDLGQINTTPSSLTTREFNVQVLMWNPQVFPALPEQYSNGLAVRILPDGGVVTVPYGTSTGGMTVWAETFTSNGKKYVQFPFDVPLM